MSWHAQPTSATLRYYADDANAEQAYVDRVEPTALAQAELLGGKLAYLHAASRPGGGEVSRSQWRGLIRLLNAQHGVLYALVERGAGYYWICTRTGRQVQLDLPGLA